MKRIYINEEACMGCGLCRSYCQIEHSNSKDIIKAFKKGVCVANCPNEALVLSVDGSAVR